MKNFYSWESFTRHINNGYINNIKIEENLHEGHNKFYKGNPEKNN